MLLSKYFLNLREVIEKFDNYGFSEIIDIREEKRAGKLGMIKIRVDLVDGSSLIIREYIDAKYRIERVNYVYQYQDRDGELIFRYDNASHKPALGFTEHKHISPNKIIKAELPDIRDIVDEVISHL